MCVCMFQPYKIDPSRIDRSNLLLLPVCVLDVTRKFNQPLLYASSVSIIRHPSKAIRCSKNGNTNTKSRWNNSGAEKRKRKYYINQTHGTYLEKDYYGAFRKMGSSLIESAPPAIDPIYRTDSVHHIEKDKKYIYLDRLRRGKKRKS